MARPSSESLSVAAVSIPVRPDAPSDLTEYQRSIWDAVTNTKPPEWFESDSFPILRAYCIASERHRDISQELDKMEITTPDAKALMDMEEKQAKLIAALAVKMRLTQQSRYTPQAAATANKKTASGKGPWQT